MSGNPTDGDDRSVAELQMLAPMSIVERKYLLQKEDLRTQQAKSRLLAFSYNILITNSKFQTRDSIKSSKNEQKLSFQLS